MNRDDFTDTLRDLHVADVRDDGTTTSEAISNFNRWLNGIRATAWDSAINYAADQIIGPQLIFDSDYDNALVAARLSEFTNHNPYRYDDEVSA